MGVLTYKELEEKKKNGKNPKHITKGKVEKIKEPSPVVKKYVYQLLHPEIPENMPLNFEDDYVVDGESYKRKCINGVIKTNENKLANYLIKQGYAILSKEEVKE